ncbi:aminopeptidase P family protein [Moraxella sp. VT-16-12]|uniref:aminopeptidase P family protein n=1 Tax=Moraxella sp. VT-16-12 TaxID=2014877 RepID=UPI000B7DE4FD|nr:aminopeptidase P family protein [Moraxella sp. VT-16-12]TWV83987.1 aminopeptidase P family protein [Moraxella sp. VT-16-12]
MIKQRISAVRQYMQSQNIDVIIVPTSDPHLSEYLPEHWQTRKWLSGFTGSAGVLVMTADFAGLWTDSRYWVQAEIELGGTGIVLKKQGQDTDIAEFLLEHFTGVQKPTLAIDKAVFSLAYYERLQKMLADVFVFIDMDVVGQVWQFRPPLPCADVVVHDTRFVDTSAKDKLQQVRQQIQQLGADWHLISSLDDIAWLTNLRGSDVAFNPVFLAHLLIGQDETTLFVDGHKLTSSALTALAQAGIDVAPYDDVQQAICNKQGVLLIDPNKVAVGTLSSFNKDNIKYAMNPSTLLKAIKSPQDISHIKNAMRQDGVALCEFFAELDECLERGEMVSELDVADRLTYYRSQQAHYVSPSFDTIAGFGANGAIVHYKATPERFAYLVGDGLLLIDSGAQYHNGTTDITRMVGVGHITDEQKTDITQVLKAHIALAVAHFPKDLPSPQIDIVARAKLWAVGKDYGHGTGHGVGYFLNVHEGPQAISYTAPQTPERALQVGMISSNEPGLYRQDKWGIRLENLMAVKPAPDSEFGEFLCFETLTLCPFDERLILPHLLDNDEKAWLNAYHQQVYDELVGHLSARAKAWLTARTQPIKI